MKYESETQGIIWESEVIKEISECLQSSFFLWIENIVELKNSGIFFPPSHNQEKMEGNSSLLSLSLFHSSIVLFFIMFRIFKFFRAFPVNWYWSVLRRLGRLIWFFLSRLAFSSYEPSSDLVSSELGVDLNPNFPLAV